MGEKNGSKRDSIRIIERLENSMEESVLIGSSTGDSVDGGGAQWEGNCGH